MKRSSIARQPAALALSALTCGCTGGATRIAHDVESGVEAARESTIVELAQEHGSVLVIGVR